MEGSGSGTYPGKAVRRGENRGIIESNQSDSSERSLTSDLTSENPITNIPNRIKVSIFGQSYHIIGDEDPERVKQLAHFVDSRMKEIAQHSKGISQLKIAILAALNIAEEMLKLQEKNRNIAYKGDKLISLLSGAVEEK
ncbi:cell division protein ZapA [bacterium]|nr:cell division protein ZapA [candidate division CSSED10-310 bacterium]